MCLLHLLNWIMFPFRLEETTYQARLYYYCCISLYLPVFDIIWHVFCLFKKNVASDTCVCKVTNMIYAFYIWYIILWLVVFIRKLSSLSPIYFCDFLFFCILINVRFIYVILKVIINVNTRNGQTALSLTVFALWLCL